MKYSVIIPVYKTEPYFHLCVESVLRQTYTDFEIILVDDGSPDGCPMMCDEFRKQDGRIKVIHQKNAGLGFARNAGIDAAQGEFLVFLDSDDYWLKDSALNIIDRSIHGCDLAVFDLKRFTGSAFDPPDLDCFRAFQNNYDSGIEFLKAALENSTYFPWYFCRFVFKASLFADKTLRFTDHKTHEDVALSYRVILKANKVHIIKDALYAYRQNRQDSLTQTVTYDTVYAVLSVAEQEIRRVQAMPLIPDSVRALLCDNLSKGFFDSVTLSSRLPGPEREKIWGKLEQCLWIAKYGVGKEKAKAILIRLFGCRTLARMLGFKWKLQKSWQA